MCLQTIYFLTKHLPSWLQIKLPIESILLYQKSVTYPDFLDIQIGAFKDFFQIGVSADTRKEEGLWQVFNDHFPISDSRNNFVLEFIDYNIDPPRYSIKSVLKED